MVHPPDAHKASTIRASELLVAGFAAGAIVVHDAAHISAGRWWDVFWVCNVAALLPAVAILRRSALLATVALTGLVPGTAVWLADVGLSGATILSTSYGVHLGGTFAAAWAVARYGRSTPAAAWAFALFAGCFGFSMLVLPEAANVNAAHSIPPGWSFLGEGRTAFVLSLVLLTLAAIGIGQLAAAGLARLRR